MPELQPEVQQLINGFRRRDDTPVGAADALQQTIESSPYLAAAMADAARSGALKHIEVMRDPHRAGVYDGTDTIRLELGNFDRDLWRPGQLEDNLAVVMGHETGHALMADATRRHTYLLEGSVEQALRASLRDAMADGVERTEPVDLTPQATRYLDAMRANEGLAELVGMNALASRVSGGEADQFNRADFLTRVEPSTRCVDPPLTSASQPRLNAGITLGPDGIQRTGGTIDSQSIDRVAQCFFDEGQGLGPKGESSYRDIYGADVIERVANIWNEQAGSTRTLSPPVLDVATLKLDPDAVSRAGLDLGGQGREFAFYSSRQQPTMDSVEQLYPTPPSKGMHRSHSHDDAVSNEISPAVTRPLADQPSHPAFNDFERILQVVHASGRWNEQESRNITASLLKAHTEDPLAQRLDTAVVGKPLPSGDVQVFAVYSPHGAQGPHFHSSVSGDIAAKEPAQRNLEQTEQLREQQVQARMQEQAQQLDNPAQRGPHHSL